MSFTLIFVCESEYISRVVSVNLIAELEAFLPTVKSDEPPTWEYENIFVGNVWSQKGLSSKYGIYVQDDIIPGSTTYAVIDSSGNSVLATLSSTATAKDTEVYTANNSIGSGIFRIFPVTNLASFNPIVKNNDRLLLSSGPAGSGLTICQETTNATGFRIDNSTLKFAASGAVQFWLENAPSGSYSGFDSLGNMVLQDGLNVAGITSIDSAGLISGPSANITTITTTTQANTDNSTKVATTAFVKSQGYISGTSTANTFTATNTFQFSTLNATPLLVKSTRTSPNPQLSFCVDTSATAYNPIVQAGDAILFTDNCPGIYVGTHTSAYAGFRCDNLTTTIYGKSTLAYYIWDKGATPALQLNATNNVSNSRLDCKPGIAVTNGPISPPTTSVATTSFHMGFQFSATLTTPTTSASQSLGSITFDNASNLAYGTYYIEYHHNITTSTAGIINTALNTSLILTGNYASNTYTPGVSFNNTINQSAIIQIYATTTYYLMFHIPSIAYTYNNGLFRVTRIA